MGNILVVLTKIYMKIGYYLFVTKSRVIDTNNTF